MIAMPENHQGETNAAADAACRVLETRYCPRDGRRVSVLFEFSGGGVPVRSAVALCPLDTYSNRFIPALGGPACDQACLQSR